MNETTPSQTELDQTAEVLLTSKNSILEIWKKQIQTELPAARGKSKVALEDHMPELLETMAFTLREGNHSGDTKKQNELSKKHGRQRAGLDDYTLEEVLEEYRIAREITIFEMNKKISLSIESQCMVNRIIDRAIVESGTEFAKLKDAENAEAKLRAEEAQNRAEIANQAKTDFLANISHEIRTPLGAVLGFTELMRDPSLSLADRNSFAEIVNRNGRQISTLINDILDIAKIEAGQMLIESIPISLPAIVAEVTTLLRSSAIAKGIALNVESWGDIPLTIRSDPTRLTQILTNLIGNAIKFTSKGEVRVSLRQNLELGENYFSFIVTDTGIGISEENKSRLFKSFIQADTSTTRMFGGSGLGLFLSKNLAIALGGDLSLKESELNKGSTFVATFKAEVLNVEDVATQIRKKQFSRNIF